MTETPGPANTGPGYSAEDEKAFKGLASERTLHESTLELNVSFKESQRATNVVATFGPGPDMDRADETRDARVTELLEAGVNVFRINFSHGTHEDHAKNVEAIRRISAELGKPVAILADLQGPKTRIGKVPGGKVVLAEDDYVTLKYGKGSEDGEFDGSI